MFGIFFVWAIGGGIVSKGLWANSYLGARKVGEGYNPSHASETLIG